jgi:hypothetical protein
MGFVFIAMVTCRKGYATKFLLVEILRHDFAAQNVTRFLFFFLFFLKQPIPFHSFFLETIF